MTIHGILMVLAALLTSIRPQQELQASEIYKYITMEDELGIQRQERYLKRLFCTLIVFF